MRAYIIGVVEDTSHKPACSRNTIRGGEISLEMADCYDEIALHFELRTLMKSVRTAFTRCENLAEIILQFEIRSRSRSIS